MRNRNEPTPASLWSAAKGTRAPVGASLLAYGETPRSCLSVFAATGRLLRFGAYDGIRGSSARLCPASITGCRAEAWPHGQRACIRRHGPAHRGPWRAKEWIQLLPWPAPQPALLSPAWAGGRVAPQSIVEPSDRRPGSLLNCAPHSRVAKYRRCTVRQEPMPC